MSSRGHRALSVAILGSTEGMKLCPPNPGSTLRHNTMSSSPSSASAATPSAGVDGFSAIAARIPSRRIFAASARAAAASPPTASQWNVTELAPAAARGSTSAPGSAHDRWQSRNAPATHCVLRCATTGGPIVRFGTNRPSMRSTWSQSAPSASARATSDARLPWSAARSEGATIARTRAVPAVPFNSGGPGEKKAVSSLTILVRRSVAASSRIEAPLRASPRTTRFVA